MNLKFKMRNSDTLSIRKVQTEFNCNTDTQGHNKYASMVDEPKNNELTIELKSESGGANTSRQSSVLRKSIAGLNLSVRIDNLLGIGEIEEGAKVKVARDLFIPGLDDLPAPP